MTELALGVDIGGTNLRVGAVDGMGTVGRTTGPAHPGRCRRRPGRCRS